jgi:hypothetical protein
MTKADIIYAITDYINAPYGSEQAVHTLDVLIRIVDDYAREGVNNG